MKDLVTNIQNYASSIYGNIIFTVIKDEQSM